jgi:hypothetical protein
MEQRAYREHNKEELSGAGLHWAQRVSGGLGLSSEDMCCVQVIQD